MKLAYNQIDPYLKSPTPSHRMFLFYGPNNGLVSERAKSMAKLFVEDLQDAFQVLKLSPDELKNDPGKLGSELMSLPFMGGNKVIWIRGAEDALTKDLAAFIEENDITDINYLILESGDLKPKSTLRALFEKEKEVGCIPCYEDDSRQIASLIREEAKKHNIPLNGDIVRYLTDHLSQDRLMARSELDKLFLFAEVKDHLTLEDVMESMENSQDTSTQDIILGLFDGNIAGLEKNLNMFWSQGFSEIALIRGIIRHLSRLIEIQDLSQGGLGKREVMSKMRPPIFFKVQDSFWQQSRRWSRLKIEKALDKVIALEEKAKLSGTTLSQTICRQELLGLCLAARPVKS